MLEALFVWENLTFCSRDASPERKDASPEPRALSPAPQERFGLVRIRYPKSEHVSCAAREQKGLEQEQKGFRRNREVGRRISALWRMKCLLRSGITQLCGRFCARCGRMHLLRRRIRQLRDRFGALRG
jgi:hypothetical protein